MRLVYTNEAVEDLTRLRDFIAKHNPDAAARIAAELIKRIEQLLKTPNIGHPVDRAPQATSIRDMVFGNYIVRYSTHAETLIVLRAWHRLENRA